MIRIFVASDHAGVELKNAIVQKLRSSQFLPNVKHDVEDLGPQTLDSVDYPDYADLVCRKIHGFSLISSDTSAKSHLNEAGILICGSGQGMAMRANKYPHIRAAICWTPEIAKLSREHNDANVLCLASRFTSEQICHEIVQTFLSTTFAGGRHSQRVAKVNSPL